MQYSDILNSYKSASLNGKSTEELMVQVFERLRNNMQAAKKALIEEDYVERGKQILRTVGILETLAKSVVVKDEIVGSKETLMVYERLGYLIENLIPSNAKPEEYDYYINYFENLKSVWQDFSIQKNMQGISNSSEGLNINISSKSGETEIKDIQPFNKDGKFEVVM